MEILSGEPTWPWWWLRRFRVERDSVLCGLLNGDIGTFMVLSIGNKPLGCFEKSWVSSTRSTAPLFYNKLVLPWSAARSNCHRWARQSSHGAAMDGWPRHCRSFNSLSYWFGVLSRGHPMQKRLSWLEQEIPLRSHWIWAVDHEFNDPELPGLYEPVCPWSGAHGLVVQICRPIL
jgi:hypothetical protein